MSDTALFDLRATESLTDEEQRELIAIAQDVPVTIEDTEDGERLIYGTTPAADAALDRLTRAFMPALRTAANRSTHLDHDTDAFGIVLEEFVKAVRAYDVTSSLPFAATIKTILRFAIVHADRTHSVINVPERVSGRYYALMSKHGGDVQAAYQECRTELNGFDPLTFLAVHYALAGASSIDVTAGESDNTYRAAPGGTANISSVEKALGQQLGDGIEDFITRDLVEHLLAAVEPHQEDVLRHRYGFRDLATETSLVRVGLRPGEVLTDDQVAFALGRSRATVQRQKKAGLAAAKAAYDNALADE